MKHTPNKREIALPENYRTFVSFSPFFLSCVFISGAALMYIRYRYVCLKVHLLRLMGMCNGGL